MLAFAGLMAAMGWERLRPFRLRAVPRLRHDLTNLGLWLINAGVLQLFASTAGIAAAALVAQRQTGLLHQLDLPRFLSVALTILILDAIAYGMHRIYHAVPVLWRLHAVHHSDGALGATTGVRFHAFEVLLSAVARLLVVIAIGADVFGVVAFESLLLLASQLQHADVRLSGKIDASFRRWLVTPNLHRIHHSVQRAEADSNYGTILTLWDRWFGTLRTEPLPQEINVGLPESAVAEPTSLLRLLSMPFDSREEALSLRSSSRR